MLNEVEEIKINASKVKEGGVPKIPVLMFSSNRQGTVWNEGEWQTLQENYIETIEYGELINLDSSHYVHDIEYEKIADETKAFITKLRANDYEYLIARVICGNTGVVR